MELISLRLRKFPSSDKVRLAPRVRWPWAALISLNFSEPPGDARYLSHRPCVRGTQGKFYAELLAQGCLTAAFFSSCYQLLWALASDRSCQQLEIRNPRLWLQRAALPVSSHSFLTTHLREWLWELALSAYPRSKSRRDSPDCSHGGTVS